MRRDGRGLLVLGSAMSELERSGGGVSLRPQGRPGGRPQRRDRLATVREPQPGPCCRADRNLEINSALPATPIRVNLQFWNVQSSSPTAPIMTALDEGNSHRSESKSPSNPQSLICVLRWPLPPRPLAACLRAGRHRGRASPSRRAGDQRPQASSNIASPAVPPMCPTHRSAAVIHGQPRSLPMSAEL